MTSQTRYEATETGVDIIIRGRDEWRKSATYPTIIGKLDWENVAWLMNNAYQLGRADQQTDIRNALGVK
jgi:hypothetical protein